jgi:hypothetical protein
VKGGIFLGDIYRFAKTQELIYELYLSPRVKTQNRRSSSSCRRTDRTWRTEVCRFQSPGLQASRDSAEARNEERRTGKTQRGAHRERRQMEEAGTVANLGGGRLGRRTGDDVPVNPRRRRRTPWTRLVDAKLLVMSDCSGLALGRRIVWISEGTGRLLAARVFTDGSAPVNFRQQEPSAELWLHVLVASPCSGTTKWRRPAAALSSTASAMLCEAIQGSDAGHKGEAQLGHVGTQPRLK